MQLLETPTEVKHLKYYALKIKEVKLFYITKVCEEKPCRFQLETCILESSFHGGKNSLECHFLPPPLKQTKKTLCSKINEIQSYLY